MRYSFAVVIDDVSLTDPAAVASAITAIESLPGARVLQVERLESDDLSHSA